MGSKGLRIDVFFVKNVKELLILFVIYDMEESLGNGFFLTLSKEVINKNIKFNLYVSNIAKTCTKVIKKN